MGLSEIIALKQAARLPKEPKRYTIPKKSAKRIAQEKAERELRSPEGTELQKWYAAIMNNEDGKCWETGERIDKRGISQLKVDYPEMTEDEIIAKWKQIQFGWHGSIAHILDKANYPSVRTHPQNYMVLKMWGGIHGQYDSSWENASKMKIWPYACKIINILYPLLTRGEKAKLPDIIIQEIKPETYIKNDS